MGGLGDGLSGVEWEAEVAFAVTPGIFGLAGFLMAVIGGEGGAEFIGAVRFRAKDEWFMGDRILLSTTRFGNRLSQLTFSVNASHTKAN